MTVFNNNFERDLIMGEMYERKLSDKFAGKSIEVKTDLMWCETGNIFIEYQCRNKPSGIETTLSEDYIFILPFDSNKKNRKGTDNFLIASWPTNILKKVLQCMVDDDLIRAKEGGETDRTTGKKVSMGYVIKPEDISNYIRNNKEKLLEEETHEGNSNTQTEQEQQRTWQALRT